MSRIRVLLATSLLTIGPVMAQTTPSTPAIDQPRAVNEAAATPSPAAPIPSAPQPTPAATQAQGQSGEGDCPAPSTVAAPATAPQPGADSTDANNAGNTGWSGGTGGSQIGTNAQGAVPASPTWQPPTARGLDLTGRAEPAVAQAAPDC